MIKLLLIYLVLISSLSARENPFFPSKNETDIPYSTNKTVKIKPLNRVAISLPSTARTLESVTITYKNLDGSIMSKKELLGNSVDWHLPVFVSQNIGGNEKKIASKPKRSKDKKLTKIAALSFISLYASKNHLKIVTKDRLLRNFLLTKPHRIVCDFQRNIDIRSYEKTPKSATAVTRIRLGNHKGYYRLVIELDGHYKYILKDTKAGYSLKLL